MRRVCVAVCLMLLLVVPVSAADEPVKLTLLVRPSSVYEKVLERFAAEHPHVEVEIVLETGGAFKHLEKVTVMAAGGLMPDVMWIHSYTVAEMIRNGMLLGLNDLIASEGPGFMDDFFPPTIEDLSEDGIIYGLPRETSTMVVYYMQDMFDNAGLDYPWASWTLEDMLDLARKLTKPDGPRPQWGLELDNLSPHARHVSLVHAMGGRLVNEERNRSTLDDPQTIAALQWIADLAHVHGVAGLSTDFAPHYGRTTEDFMTNGALAMAIEILAMSTRLPQEAAWDVAPIPAGPAGQFTRVAGSGYGISRTTAHPEAAWELLKYLSDYDAQMDFAAGGSIVPARRSVIFGSGFLEGGRRPESINVFIDSLAFGVPEQVKVNWNDYVVAKARALDPLWRGQMSAAQVAAAANDSLTAIINR